MVPWEVLCRDSGLFVAGVEGDRNMHEWTVETVWECYSMELRCYEREEKNVLAQAQAPGLLRGVGVRSRACTRSYA